MASKLLGLSDQRKGFERRELQGEPGQDVLVSGRGWKNTFFGTGRLLLEKGASRRSAQKISSSEATWIQVVFPLTLPLPLLGTRRIRTLGKGRRP